MDISTPRPQGRARLAGLRESFHLVRTIADRELTSRYRDSVLGIVWALVLPVCLLGIYGFVFSQVFETRWDSPSGDRAQFALLLFSGLIIFNVFAETVNGATTLVQRNAVLIKRTQFRAELLPIASLLASLYTLALSLVPFFGLYLVLDGLPPWHVVLLPIVVAPLFTITLALAYFIAGLSAFVRDLKHLIGLATTMILFTSPIFFPLDILPERFRDLAQWLNPVFATLPESKRVLFWGFMPNWLLLVGLQAVGLALLWLGRRVFMRLQPGFADVV